MIMIALERTIFSAEIHKHFFSFFFFFINTCLFFLAHQSTRLAIVITMCPASGVHSALCNVCCASSDNNLLKWHFFINR